MHFLNYICCYNYLNDFTIVIMYYDYIFEILGIENTILCL